MCNHLNSHSSVRFRELLLEFSGNEENSETLLEALDPVIMKPSFSAERLAQHPTVGLAASQLSLWVQGVVRLHSTLQTRIRPLQLKVSNMKAALNEYSDKLKKEENKVGSVCYVRTFKDKLIRCFVKTSEKWYIANPSHS